VQRRTRNTEEEQGTQKKKEPTVNIKSIARILAGLALASSVAAATGLGTGAPLAHASYRPGPCPYVSCYQAPSLTLIGGNGGISISGANWSANSWIEVTVFNPDGTNTPQLGLIWAYSDSSGSFHTSYSTWSGCFNGLMEVEAIDQTTYKVVTGYAVPGCII
jgi:hypothetical protein